MNEMYGHLSVDGMLLQRAGFMRQAIPDSGLCPTASAPLFQRVAGLSQANAEFIARCEQIQRGDMSGDLSAMVHQMGLTIADMQRNITSGMTAFPVRENLEAEAKVLIPLDTPVRNFLPRKMGSGKSSAWKQLSSMGGGWLTTLDQPGSAAAVRAFFAESGAPAEFTSVYVDKSATYKLLGAYGSVTGFAAASGNNYMNQIATEKSNVIRNLMLNEENALINGLSTDTAAPWGDGVTALAFNGLVNLITTANGTPTAQVQTSVGGLTLSHIDNQLKRLWNQGGMGQYMIMNAQEILSLVHLAEANGSIIRVQAGSSSDTILGVAVTGYKHPITGEIVPIMASRFLPAGTILFGSKYLPDGSPAADVEVLPQVQLPQLAPTENIQGYAAQELAPTIQAPQVYPFIVSVYEVLRMKSAYHFGKSTGVTAV